jgi:hypothetical protein
MKTKKTYYFWGVLLGLALCVAIYFVAHRYKEIPSLAVYNRYKECEGLDVSFIRDFRLNDTMSVSVTLIIPQDSLAWDNLLKSLNILPYKAIHSENGKSKNKDYSSRNTVKGHPELRSTTKEYDLMAWSYARKILAVFEINDREEALLIDLHEIDALTTDSTYFYNLNQTNND